MRCTGLCKHKVTYECGTRTINQQTASSKERNVVRKQLVKCCRMMRFVKLTGTNTHGRPPKYSSWHTTESRSFIHRITVTVESKDAREMRENVELRKFISRSGRVHNCRESQEETITQRLIPRVFRRKTKKRLLGNCWEFWKIRIIVFLFSQKR